MTHYLYKLIPSRPTFFTDQSPHEQQVMLDHVSYWTALLEQGAAVAFGPVIDPVGTWGVAIIESDAATISRIAAADPAVVGGVGTVETYEMAAAIVRPWSSGAADCLRDPTDPTA